jgi:hypothetical protein
MKYGRLFVIGAAFALWAMMPRASAYAVCLDDSAWTYTYVNCSTGAPPFTPTKVGPNSSQEQQVTCYEGDTATGGGIEVMSPALPLAPSTIVTTPENSFLFSDTTPIGWQVVVQNTNVDPVCNLLRRCPAIQFRVCVGCLHTDKCPG